MLQQEKYWIPRRHKLDLDSVVTAMDGRFAYVVLATTKLIERVATTLRNREYEKYIYSFHFP